MYGVCIPARFDRVCPIKMIRRFASCTVASGRCAYELDSGFALNGVRRTEVRLVSTDLRPSLGLSKGASLSPWLVEERAVGASKDPARDVQFMQLQSSRGWEKKTWRKKERKEGRKNERMKKGDERMNRLGRLVANVKRNILSLPPRMFQAGLPHSTQPSSSLCAPSGTSHSCPGIVSCGMFG